MSRVGQRFLPQAVEPAQAWVEHEKADKPQGGTAFSNPSESRCLLNEAPSTKKHAGMLKPNCFKRLGTKLKKCTEHHLLDILKPPYFIITVILINIGIHLWLPEQMRSLLVWSTDVWRREPWRLLSYGLVHGSDAHLVMNAVIALVVGWLLEREQAWWRVACVWVGCMAAGALGAGVLTPRDRVLGASAAVYGLLTAHLPNVCLRFGHMPLWWLRPPIVAANGVAVTWRALSHAARADNHVAWAAHALGAAAGLPLAMLLFRGENDSKLAIKASRVVSLLLLAGGLLAATLHFTIFYDI